MTHDKKEILLAVVEKNLLNAQFSILQIDAIKRIIYSIVEYMEGNKNESNQTNSQNKP